MKLNNNSWAHVITRINNSYEDYLSTYARYEQRTVKQS